MLQRSERGSQMYKYLLKEEKATTFAEASVVKAGEGWRAEGSC